MTGTLRHFFGSCSSLLRVRFGKTGLFPKNSRTRVGECPENRAFPAGYSCPEALTFTFNELLIFSLFICRFHKHRIFYFLITFGSSCCFVNAYILTNTVSLCISGKLLIINIMRACFEPISMLVNLLNIHYLWEVKTFEHV